MSNTKKSAQEKQPETASAPVFFSPEVGAVEAESLDKAVTKIELKLKQDEEVGDAK